MANATKCCMRAFKCVKILDSAFYKLKHLDLLLVENLFPGCKTFSESSIWIVTQKYFAESQQLTI